MDTITHQFMNRKVLVNVTGAPPVTGFDARGRSVTVHPARIEFFEGIPDYEDRPVEPKRMALVTGRYDRETATSAVYKTVRVDLRLPSSAPDWLLGLAATYLPEATQ